MKVKDIQEEEEDCITCIYDTLNEDSEPCNKCSVIGYMDEVDVSTGNYYKSI